MKRKIWKGKAPFTIFSSSVSTGYQGELTSQFSASCSIEDLHNDTYLFDGSVPMQGPFTETHIGGYQHRHAPLSASADPALIARQEGANLVMTKGSPNKITLSRQRLQSRDPVAKRPVNVQNIKHKTGSYQRLGNYSKDYDIFQCHGRQFRNKDLINSGGFGLTVSSSSYIYGNIDYLVPQRTRQEYCFTSRFSSPGDVNTSPNLLDIDYGEFSPYNALPFRNADVRFSRPGSLRDLLSDECLQFGRDIATDLTASYHKVNRNTKSVLSESYGGIVSTGSQPDNGWFSRPLPQDDRHYAWIANSLAAVQESASFDYTDYNHPERCNLTFLSSSENVLKALQISDNGENEPYLDVSALTIDGWDRAASTFENVSLWIQDELDEVNMILGGGVNKKLYQYFFKKEDADNLVGAVPTKYGPNLFGLIERFGPAYGFEPFEGSTTQPFLDHDGYSLTNNDTLGLIYYTVTGYLYQNNYWNPKIFNALMLQRNGPYGYCSWKQVRMGYNKVARYLKKHNIISVAEKSKVLDAVANVIRPTTIEQFDEPCVTSRHFPLITNIEDQSDKIVLKYSFGNNLNHFANEKLDKKKNAYTTEKQFYNELYEEYSKKSINSKVCKSLKYKEKIWPTTTNEGMQRILDRTNYLTLWWESNTHSLRHTSRKKTNAFGWTYPNTTSMFGTVVYDAHLRTSTHYVISYEIADTDFYVSAWPLDARSKFETSMPQRIFDFGLSTIFSYAFPTKITTYAASPSEIYHLEYQTERPRPGELYSTGTDFVYYELHSDNYNDML